MLAFKAVLRRDYLIYTALTADIALTILEDEQVDLIISDQRMPGTTGVELLEKVSKLYPDIIRMVLTGFSDVESIIDSVNKGKIFHYISKPWNVKELKLILGNAFKHFELKRENLLLESQKRDLEIKTIAQENANIIAQYEVLKNQINPHFLFNSMNILTSLIRKDGEKAILFTQRFSKLYRNLLELRDEITIPLDQEITFVENYFFLQKMRFEGNLEIIIDIEERLKSFQIAPFTIQILAENAIKHNIVSMKEPLEIKIYSKGNYLMISNHLNPRKNKEESTKIGLQNLISRYKLISEEALVIKKEAAFFQVKIPLLAP